jgi:hypothetical protein
VSTSKLSEAEVEAALEILERLDQAEEAEAALSFVAYTMPMLYHLR